MGIRLSKSALEKFKACPKCFWLEKRQELKQPEGIRSGLPMGMDRVLKAHYDAHRQAGVLPAELRGQVPASFRLYDGSRIGMKDLRNWRKGLTVMVDGIELSTALDDLFFDSAAGRYSMLDYKTKAKATNLEDTEKYYGTQADCYSLALEANGYPSDSFGRFSYYYPEGVALPQPGLLADVAVMNWRCQVISIKADHERAKALLRAAAACLDSAIPASGPNCDYCRFLGDHLALQACSQKVPA